MTTFSGMAISRKRDSGEVTKAGGCDDDDEGQMARPVHYICDDVLGGSHNGGRYQEKDWQLQKKKKKQTDGCTRGKHDHMRHIITGWDFCVKGLLVF